MKTKPIFISEYHPFLFLILVIFFYPFSAYSAEEKGRKNYKHQLSVAAVFQDEAPYLKEWIEYHKLLGADHFYLYNNLSQDEYLEVLQPYIEKGDVDLIDWPYQTQNVVEFIQLQVDVYTDALAQAKGKTKWLAVIDIDEFIVPVKDNNLVQFLKPYESKGGVCLIWSFFGTSHVEKIPEDRLMIEMLLYHAGPANGGEVAHIWNHGAYKSIFRPDYVQRIASPHYCLYINGKSHSMLSYSLIHINHYWTRDEYFLNHFKIPRREAWGLSGATTKNWAAGMNSVTGNNPILRFIPKLRVQMGMN